MSNTMNKDKMQAIADELAKEIKTPDRINKDRQCAKQSWRKIGGESPLFGRI